MPRPPRIDFPGARHHVMNRGARHAPVFSDETSCAIFLGILSDLPERFGLIVHGYSLMPNHFHLLLEVPGGNLSRAIQYLTSKYVQKWNRPHGWDGPIFRGRFRSRLVLDDAHWMHLLAYIHLNPVRAHLVPSPEKALWTSHRAYTGHDMQPEWLTCAPLLQAFGSTTAYETYVQGLHLGRRDAPTDFDEESLWTQGPVPRPPANPQVPRGIVPPSEALAEVGDVVGMPVRALVESRMGRGGNRPRSLAAWWLSRRSGLTLVEVGRLLDMSGSTTSIAIQRLLSARQRESRIDSWMDRLDLRQRGDFFRIPDSAPEKRGTGVPEEEGEM